MKSKEFLSHLADLADSLRANIEAHCAGWDDSAQAIADRVAKVKDPVTGFEYFVGNYFPHYIRHADKSNLHKYLFAQLPQLLTVSEAQPLAIAAPRGESKSTITTQLFTLWVIVTAQKRYGLLVMDSIDQAYPMLTAIKTELEANPRIMIDFPQVAGAGRVWQASTIITANNIKVQIAGAGKKLRGLRHGAYRPDYVVLDDIENDENVRSPEQRDKLHNWLKKTIMPLGAAGEKIDFVYIGTILHYDSVLNRTLNNPAWRSARFKAIIQFPDNMTLWDEWEALWQSNQVAEAEAFYATHETAMTKGSVVSWKARPIYELMKIRARDGHDAFDSEYQNDPTAGEDAPFSKAIQYWSELPSDIILFGAVDPSLGKAGASRDPSAILIGGYQRSTGKLFVIEAQIKKRLPDRIISDVISLQKKYSCALWFIETVQFQEFLYTEIVKRSAQMGVPVPCRSVKPSTDKLLRIETLQPHMKNGLILLHKEHATLISQLRHFPKADHDDGPDCLHMLWAGSLSWSNYKPAQVIHVPEPTL